MRHKRSLLAFKNTAIWLKSFQGMPNILRGVDTITAIFLAENYAFGNCAVIVICGLTYLTSQYHKVLILVRIMTNGNFGSSFQRVEYTMAQVIMRLMKTVVFSQVWQLLCFCCFYVTKLLVYISIVVNTNCRKTDKHLLENT